MTSLLHLGLRDPVDAPAPSQHFCCQARPRNAETPPRWTPLGQTLHSFCTLLGTAQINGTGYDVRSSVELVNIRIVPACQKQPEFNMYSELVMRDALNGVARGGSNTADKHLAKQPEPLKYKQEMARRIVSGMALAYDAHKKAQRKAQP